MHLKRHPTTKHGQHDLSHERGDLDIFLILMLNKANKILSIPLQSHDGGEAAKRSLRQDISRVYAEDEILLPQVQHQYPGQDATAPPINNSESIQDVIVSAMTDRTGHRVMPQVTRRGDDDDGDDQVFQGDPISAYKPFPTIGRGAPFFYNGDTIAGSVLEQQQPSLMGLQWPAPNYPSYFYSPPIGYTGNTTFINNWIQDSAYQFDQTPMPLVLDIGEQYPRHVSVTADNDKTIPNVKHEPPSSQPGVRAEETSMNDSQVGEAQVAQDLSENRERDELNNADTDSLTSDHGDEEMMQRVGNAIIRIERISIRSMVERKQIGRSGKSERPSGDGDVSSSGVSHSTDLDAGSEAVGTQGTRAQRDNSYSKRNRDIDKDGCDGGDSRKKRGDSSSKATKKRLACPYQAFEPWQRCAETKSGFESVGRLK